MYITKPGPGSRKIYFHADSDGKKKLVSIKNIPEAVRIALEAGTAEVDENVLMNVQGEQPVIDKSCLFCGVYSNWQRLVSGQLVYVCEQHYHEKTIGKVAQKLREREHARI